MAGRSSIAEVFEIASRAWSCCLADRVGIHLRVVGQCVLNKTATMLDTSLLPIWFCREICNDNLRRTASQHVPNTLACKIFNDSWEPRSSRKNSGSHIDASLSRQPLVKGERLVRYEVNAVMPEHMEGKRARHAGVIHMPFLCDCNVRAPWPAVSEPIGQHSGMQKEDCGMGGMTTQGSALV